MTHNYQYMFDALREIMKERHRQEELYPEVNDQLLDGTGPEVPWLSPYVSAIGDDARAIEENFRTDYENYEYANDLPTWAHLLREEVAEVMMESDPDKLCEELIQVAALCVSWYERIKARD